MEVFSISILALALVGLAVSYHIYHKKHIAKGKLVCVIGKDCEKVVNSKYNSTFGIHNEILGMLYYVFVALSAIVLLVGIETIAGLPVLLGLTVIAGGAALFSVWLTYVQGFILHDWCEYCLVSAGVSIAIFIIELVLVV